MTPYGAGSAAEGSGAAAGDATETVGSRADYRCRCGAVDGCWPSPLRLPAAADADGRDPNRVRTSTGTPGVHGARSNSSVAARADAEDLE